jgi:lysophospholipase L1-like esterase
MTLPPALLSAVCLCAEPGPSLVGDERIVFFGDSITQAGDYIADLESCLLLRAASAEGGEPPRLRVINHGISSETISGTSEPDHDPRRPDAHDRFDRDVAAWKPDIVVACFGMNDGNYHPFDPWRFGRYREGIGRLVDRVRAIGRPGKDGPPRLVLLTPPPFDPYRRQVGDPAAASYGYKFPAVDYDDVLGKYAQWLVGRPCEPGVSVIDVHSALNDHLARRRRDEVSFAIAPDAVHPNATGHWLMARTIARAWGLPPRGAAFRIDLPREGAPKPEGPVDEVELGDDGLRFRLAAPIPYPLRAAVDPRSVALERGWGPEESQRLILPGLRRRLPADDAKGYQILAEEEPIAAASGYDLERGIDLLLASTKYPPRVAAAQLAHRVRLRRRADDAAWRSGPRIPTADELAAPPGWPREVLELARPIGVRLRVVPLR